MKVEGEKAYHERVAVLLGEVGAEVSSLAYHWTISWKRICNFSISFVKKWGGNDNA